MNSKKQQLLDNVKYAVQKYGMEGVTVRNISDICGVNDSHLHRFYSNKEELLLDAYIRESDSLFIAMMKNLDETLNIPLDFKTKARLFFHRMWNELLADHARLTFCVYYYHSLSVNMAEEYHGSLIEKLTVRFDSYFENKEHLVLAMNALFSFMYDNAKCVADGQVENKPDVEELMFNSFYSLLSSYIKVVN